MASTCGDYECVTFSEFVEGMFIFEDICFGTDDFVKVAEKSGILMNKMNRCLVINDDNFQFEPRNKDQLQSPDGKIKLQLYKNNDQRDGNPVCIIVQNYVVACSTEDNEKIHYLLDVPNEIIGNSHKAMFFMKDIKGKTNYFTFESSLCPHWFLGFTSISGAWKLDLIKTDTEVNEKWGMGSMVNVTSLEKE
uniref:Interleukin-18 n=1 Tax=Esox lucius TaxID=8010 RepID=A0A3P8Y4X3_ESOLU